MKLLFSQSQQLFPEKSGQLFFALEKSTETITLNEEEKLLSKTSKDLTQLGQEIEKDNLKKDIETKRINDAVEKGNQLFDQMRDDIASQLPEEQATQLSPKDYGNKIEDILSGRKYQAQISSWWETNGKIIPDSYMDNLKIGAVVGTIAAGSTAGNIKDRITSATKWGAIAACAAHPTLTTGLARTVTTIGKDFIAPGFVGVSNLIMEAIDNPMGLATTLQQSNLNGKSISDTPIYQLLRHGKTSGEKFSKEISTGTQNAFELRAEGMHIGDPNLKKVMEAIDLAKLNVQNGKSANFDKTAIPAAATFVMQAAAHKMGEKEMANFRLKICNKEAVPSQVQKVLVNNAERDIVKFLQQDPVLWQTFQEEMNKQRIENAQSGITTKQLDLAKTFIDGNAEKGAEFNLADKKHGVRRFMSMGAGGIALATYIISFLTIQGVLGLKTLARPQTYKETIPNTVKKILKIPLLPLTMLGKLVKRHQAKGMLKAYEEADSSLFNKGERKKVWSAMTREDRNALIEQTKTFVDKEQKENDGVFDYKELPQIIQNKLAEIRKETK